MRPEREVAEYQQRGAIHFHPVIRLDDAERVAPPPVEVMAELLAEAIRDAAAVVSVRLPVTSRAPARSIGWGEQLDIRCIGTDPDDLTSPSSKAVAAYIAKYATKATEGFGPALDHRLTARTSSHSAATLLLSMDIHPKIVSEMLGHTQIGITLDLYSHVTATMQREAVEAFEELLGNTEGSNQGSKQGEEPQSTS